jgi:heptosyltransferase I
MFYRRRTMRVIPARQARRPVLQVMPGSRILIVRLGAMGDIIHTLPAAAALKTGHPQSRVTWVVEPQWAPLLEENPFVDRVLPFRRERFFESLRELRAERYDFAVDFQGLVKSAVVARLARPRRIFGFAGSIARERAASLFYSNQVTTTAVHMVDMRLDLAAAAGARKAAPVFPLPPGRAEGELPDGEFVLASPLAGWRSKQWPMEHYRELALRLRSLGIPLVLNGPPAARAELSQVPGAIVHCSGIAGLIDATRRAAAVIGVDSGPLHLAAALNKPGVAIYGPTDPAINGPHGDSLQVLRAPDAVTSYKRGGEPDVSMRQALPELVFEALKAGLLV